MFKLSLESQTQFVVSRNKFEEGARKVSLDVEHKSEHNCTTSLCPNNRYSRKFSNLRNFKISQEIVITITNNVAHHTRTLKPRRLIRLSKSKEHS